MLIVKKRGIQSLVRKPEQEEPLGGLGRMIEKSVFERSGVGGLDFFSYDYYKRDWRVLQCIIFSNKVYRQVCWNID